MNSLFQFVTKLSGEIGGITLFFLRTLASILWLRFDRKETLRNLYKFGVKSTPIVIVTASFTGALMVIQTAIYIRSMGAYSLLGWGAAIATFREVGPLLIGLMFSGRVGANNTAELATMKVTEQIDALRALAIDPMVYLVIPRTVSMIFMLFILTIVGNLFAILGGALCAYFLINVDFYLFFNSILLHVQLDDYLGGILKGTIFGLIIAIISCYFGLAVKGGAQGVGKVVNSSVVGSAVGIILIDYFITYLLNQ